MKELKKISPYEITENLFDTLNNGWMLITAGTQSAYNTMTASWGGFGILWNRPVTTIFIRPQRHTWQFVEREDYYTLSFFDKEWHEALMLCGTKSGRNTDKAKETGLIPTATDHSIAFKQARMIIECKKLYSDKLKENCLLDTNITAKFYPEKDFHRFTIGEIVNVYIGE